MDFKEILKKYPDELSSTAKRYMEMYQVSRSYHGVAKECGVNESTVRRCLKAAFIRYSVKKSTVPEHMDDDVDEPFAVEKYSANYDRHGNRVQHWIKVKREQQDIYRDLKESITELSQDLPQFPKSKRESNEIDPKLLAVYPLGDPHIGMLTYTPEVGQDWDLKIAEKMFLPLFNNLVTVAPPCKECLIIDLGDFWHYDGMEQKTMRSGHKVDADGRPSKMIQVGFRIMLQMIFSALQVHETVHVKVLPGNHDDLGSIFLRVGLYHVFANEPRVIIDQSPSVFQYFNWGKNLLGMHHGDKCKMAALPMIMAADQAELWGATQFRNWLVGHFHHSSATVLSGKDLQGCSVETFRSIIPGEGYAHEAGYRSPQDGKAIILHKDYGEIQRYTVNISQIRD
ncbi:MAG: hypothetical protein V3S69_02890 [Dehalococcoidales bacterium]